MDNHANKLSVLAPLSGEIIALEQVPDPVFSGKVLGDGVAIIPVDGKIYSPVNGTITTVPTTLHAYGFSTEDEFPMVCVQICSQVQLHRFLVHSCKVLLHRTSGW